MNSLETSHSGFVLTKDNGGLSGGVTAVGEQRGKACGIAPVVHLQHLLMGLSKHYPSLLIYL